MIHRVDSQGFKMDHLESSVEGDSSVVRPAFEATVEFVPGE